MRIGLLVRTRFLNQPHRTEVVFYLSEPCVKLGLTAVQHMLLVLQLAAKFTRVSFELLWYASCALSGNGLQHGRTVGGRVFDQRSGTTIVRFINPRASRVL